VADPLVPALVAALPAGRVHADALTRAAYACDASLYRVVPRAVVRPASVAELQATLAVARAQKVPVTPRAAGTSLSGQALGPGVILDVSHHWKGLEVAPDGLSVSVEPGVTGGHVNAVLRSRGRRIGPDPASIDAAMLGGIVANDSSGMCCGTAETAYATLDGLEVVLADGRLVDTRRPLAEVAPELAAGLLDLRRRLVSSPALVEKVRAAFAIKNTTGYRLDALLDHAAPEAILGHLLVGSEGTLGLVTRVGLRTVPDPPHRLTALLLLRDVPAAAEAVAPLTRSGARAVELMDRACLRSVEGYSDALPKDLPDEAAALLVEWQAATPDALASAREAALAATSSLALLRPAELTGDAQARAALWKLRKGIFPSVGATRPPGTTTVIEDVAVPVARLAPAVLDLQALLRAHGHDRAGSGVFGHAKDGNLHFVLAQGARDAAEVQRFDRFVADLVALVLRHGGSLKAEHGTGRHMAPFVRAAWGDEAYGLMRDVKSLLDPSGLLNPGVLLSDDPRGHLRDLKRLPEVDPLVDRCIECGFCEPACPSRRLTLTPRQRITVRREAARLESGDTGLDLAEIAKDWPHAGLDTCAGDGLCATACPVGIDTGELVRKLRGVERGQAAKRRALGLVRRFSSAERLARGLLSLGDAVDGLVGTRALAALTRLLPAPGWSGSIPRPAPAGLPRTERDGARAVYLPSCTARVLGAPRQAWPSEGTPTPELLVTLARRAGRPVWVPPDAAGSCCGLAFASKGFFEAQALAATRLIDKLWGWTDGGRLPAVVDASSCVLALRTLDRSVPLGPTHRERWRRLRVVDAVEQVHDELLPALAPRRLPLTVGVHATCAARKLGLEPKLLAVASACAARAHAPLALACCGAAGDRALVVPELGQAALRDEASELRAAGCSGVVAGNPACELGLRQGTGLPAASFLALVELSTRKT
jgi:D-lactate dehydrogenase